MYLVFESEVIVARLGWRVLQMRIWALFGAKELFQDAFFRIENDSWLSILGS